MKIRSLISVLSLAILISGCGFILDPLAISLDDVNLAREGAVSMKYPLTVEKVRNNIKATAEVKGWTVFRDLPEDKCFVLIDIPGFIDTTEVGIFVEALEDGSRVEVGCLNRKAQAKVANELFTILELL